VICGAGAVDVFESMAGDYRRTDLQGELIRLGARFVIAGTDTNYVLAGARQDTAALRAIKI